MVRGIRRLMKLYVQGTDGLRSIDQQSLLKSMREYIELSYDLGKGVDSIKLNI
jgi:hypothetical protein